MEHCDSEKVVSFVEWRSPFDFDAGPSLRNIVGSITSRPEVNVDHAKKIRVTILHTQGVQQVYEEWSL